jgi:hypothetical protein
MDWYQLFKDFAAPVATVIASGAAAFVAYRLGQNQIMVAKAQANIAERNWQTENEKVVLELMERRLAIYQNIQEVISDAIRTRRSDNDIFQRYMRATIQIPYLFGPEVETYLYEMRVHLSNLQLGTDLTADNTSPNYQKGVELIQSGFKGIMNFHEEAKPIFGPYIRAHQRVDAGRLTK